MSEASDEDLMASLQEGDDAALAPLMERWEVPAKRFLFRLVGNAAEAEDLAQEAFVRVYQKRSGYRKGARFSSWFFTIAANLARNRLRWWKRRPVVALHEWLEEGGDSADDTSGPRSLEQREAQSGRIARVQQALLQLSMDERTALVLFEFEDKSMAEIAAIEDCTAKAVENRLYRARKALARHLSDLKSPV